MFKSRMKQDMGQTGHICSGRQEENKSKVNSRVNVLRQISSKELWRKHRRLSKKVLVDTVLFLKFNELNISEGGKKMSESKKKDLMDDCEFMVAADLTLYANPLRCLKKTAKPPQEHPETGPDMIAADLVKYGSPLDK